MSRKSFYKQTAKVEAASTTTMYEVEKPSHFSQTETVVRSKKKVIGKSQWLLWFVITGLIFLVLLVIGFAGVSWWFASSFEKTASAELAPMVTEAWSRRGENLFTDRPYKTFLLLGLDQSSDGRDDSILSDTIIFAKVMNNGTVKMTSIPRDLWLDSLKTKINALYYYGQQSNPGDGITLVSSVMTEITGYPVDYFFIITMDTVKALVDAVGGVDVPVVRSFVDREYPREIDVTSKDMSVLYETVQFDTGLQHMDGTRALQFIRSRHSQDAFEGTDEGREQRQQLLLTTLKQKLMQSETISNPFTLGSLHAVWKTSVKTNMDETEVLLLGKSLYGQQLVVEPRIIPIQDASQSGLLYHPLVGPARQWVYLPVDETWNGLRQWFEEQW